MEEKREKILDNLGTLIKSNMAYIRYIETYGDSNSLMSDECDINHIKATYAAFILVLWKDEYIFKNDEKKIFTVLSKSGLNKLVSDIATRNSDGTWNIGDIKLENSYCVVDKVRNKVAHGDYLIEENNFIIDDNNKIGKINIDSLFKFCASIAVNWEKLKLSGKNSSSVIETNINQCKLFDKIKGVRKFEKALEYFYIIEYVDFPMVGHERNEQYLDVLSRLKLLIEKSIRGGNKNIDEILKPYKKLMNSIGLNLKVNRTPVTKLEGIEKVKNMYFENKKDFDQLNFLAQINYLSVLLNNLTNNKMEKKNISYGLMANINYIQKLTNDSKMTLDDIAESQPNVTLSLYLLADQTRISAYLTAFYVVYIYGLEQIYTAEDKDYIFDIFNAKMFDFSFLNLSNINPMVLKIEKEFSEFEGQIGKLKKQQEGYYKSLKNQQENYMNYAKKNDVKDDAPKGDAVKSKLINKAADIYISIKDNQKLIDIAEKFMKDDFEDYKKNRSIIEHLRNSIAHGNVYVDVLDGASSLLDTSIIFKDIYKDELTFELEIKLKDFLTLFSCNNLNIIYDYINNNTKQYENHYENKKL